MLLPHHLQPRRLSLWKMGGLGLAGMTLSLSAGNTRQLFQAAQAEYQAERRALTLPLERLHLARLSALERTLAEAALYEQAMQCREKRLAMEQALDPEAIAGPIELIMVAGEATSHGDLRLDARANGGVLTGWDSSEEATMATWALPSLPPGGYQVWIEHAPLEAMVPVRVAEAFYHVDGALAKGGSTTDKESVRTSLGYLRVTRESGAVSLSVTGDHAKAAQLKVHGLILVAQAPS